MFRIYLVKCSSILPLGVWCGPPQGYQKNQKGCYYFRIILLYFYFCYFYNFTTVKIHKITYSFDILFWMIFYLYCIVLFGTQSLRLICLLQAYIFHQLLQLPMSLYKGDNTFSIGGRIVKYFDCPHTN